MELTEAAVAAARLSGDNQVLARVLCNAAMAIASPGTLNQRVAWMEEALVIVDDLVDPQLATYAARYLGLYALETGDQQTMRGFRERSAQVAARVPTATWQWIVAMTESWHAVLAGDLDAADQAAHRAFEIGLANGEPDAVQFFGGQLVSVRYYQNRLVETIPLLEQAIAGAPALLALRAPLAMAHAQAGNRDEAIALLEEGRANGYTAIDSDTNLSTWICWLQASRDTGYLSGAERLRELFAPWTDRLVTNYVTVSTSVLHGLALLDHMLGELDRADAEFAEADRFNRKLGAPMFIASTQVAWASLLVDRDRGDDRDRGLAMAQAAHDEATEHAWPVVIADAERLLERAS